MYTFLESSDLSETKNQCFHLKGKLFVPPSSSSSLWILSVQIWTHSAQPRWALGSDKSYSL